MNLFFNQRQWNQIQAALRFWNAVAKHSKVHPTEHPAVESCFGRGHPLPMTEDEIDIIIESGYETLSEVVCSLRKAIRQYPDITVQRLRRYMKYRHTQPLFTIGKYSFFRRLDLLLAVRELRIRDETFARHYSILLPQPEKTRGDSPE